VNGEQRLVVGSPPAATRPAAPALHLAEIEREEAEFERGALHRGILLARHRARGGDVRLSGQEAPGRFPRTDENSLRHAVPVR
jgi:hypothetical protein